MKGEKALAELVRQFDVHSDRIIDRKARAGCSTRRPRAWIHRRRLT